MLHISSLYLHVYRTLARLVVTERERERETVVVLSGYSNGHLTHTPPKPQHKTRNTDVLQFGPISTSWGESVILSKRGGAQNNAIKLNKEDTRMYFYFEGIFWCLSTIINSMAKYHRRGLNSRLVKIQVGKVIRRSSTSRGGHQFNPEAINYQWSASGQINPTALCVVNK